MSEAIFKGEGRLSRERGVSSIGISCNISSTRDSVSSGYPNTEKRVENTTRSGIFGAMAQWFARSKFEVFG